MDTPMDVAVDSGGRLWVADANNNRLLRFENAALKTNGADADGVLGQRDFDSRKVDDLTGWNVLPYRPVHR